MTGERGTRAGAAGAVAVGLFLAGSALIGDRPAFDASGTEIAAHLEHARTRTQIGCVLLALAVPFLVWFLAAVASLARDAAPGARRAANAAFGCGLVFVAVFLADVTALAVAALRPADLAATPELATALVDFELLAMGVAAPTAAAMLASFALLALRHGAVWPAWVGWLAALAAAAYLLRTGTLFTTTGPFAADGPLGLWVPVGALAGWVFVAAIAVAFRPAGSSSEGGVGHGGLDR
jgi:hypothetical protein